mgnify:CR=1 FL=1
MPETTEENYVSIDTAVKSISIKDLEQCIAAAVAEATNSSKLNCHIGKIEAEGMLDSVKLKLSLSNELGDIGF